MIYKYDKDAYNRTARKGGKTLLFAKSGTDNVMSTDTYDARVAGLK
jgi:hypothetical protein